MNFDPGFDRRQGDKPAVKVLLVSARASLREQIRDRLEPLRWDLREACSGAEALENLHQVPDTDLLLLDPILPDLLPAEFCGMVRHRFQKTEILTMNTSTGHVLVGSNAPTAFGTQLADLLYHGPAPSPSIPSVPLATEYRRPDSSGAKLRGLIGDSRAMMQVYDMTHKVAARETTVLITGESGTGKDLIAQAVHMISPRRKSPFIVVNCAAIPEALLEAELFGYAKGAFTGAMQARIGRIHAAQGGTLFLDEIGDMPLSLQSKILRFLEQGEVQRLGSNDNLKVDVRVVAATNAGLPDLVRQKLFREDLFYRLSVFPIRLAPLREREDDVVLLAEHFVSRFCPSAKISPEALDVLRRHDWPGNVRELRNVIERASIMAESEHILSASDILI